MKNIRWIFIAIAVLTLCACFSEWAGDEGTITIALGAVPRSLGDRADIPRFTYTVTLVGTGGTIHQPFTGTNAVMKVMPGKWNVTVKAYHLIYDAYWSKEELRAMGEKTITVKAGQNPPETVTMISASDVRSLKELRDCINPAGDPPGEEIIIIKNDIPTAEEKRLFSSDPYPLDSIRISGNSRITLIAETPVTISSNGLFGGYDRDNVPRGFFHVVPAGSLTLGREGMSGTITIDGTNVYPGGMEIPMIFVDAGAALLMNDKVTLRNNRAGAVEISGTDYYDDSDEEPVTPGEFTMNGGTIAGNTAYLGGAVMNDGIFTMNGGAISENKAYKGGGVYNGGDDGIFTMKGGTIKDNTTDDMGPGGGVYNTGTFTMEGGTISENEAGWGGGVYADGTTSLAGGIITGNKIWEQDRADGGGKERPKRGAGAYYSSRDFYAPDSILTVVTENNPDDFFVPLPR